MRADVVTINDEAAVANPLDCDAEALRCGSCAAVDWRNDGSIVVWEDASSRPRIGVLRDPAYEPGRPWRCVCGGLPDPNSQSDLLDGLLTR